MQDLIDAVTDWDVWARRISTEADKAKTAGRPIPRPSGRSGERVAAQLVAVEAAHADRLGVSRGELHTEVVRRLRAGMSVSAAVGFALAELA